VKINNNYVVIIPALKKTVAFQDDLVKKFSGVLLIQRAINLAIKLVEDSSKVYILTDSEEIQLIAQRSKICCFYNSNLKQIDFKIDGEIGAYLQNNLPLNSLSIILSPYAPLISVELLKKAIEDLLISGKKVLRPVKSYQKNVNEKLNDSIYNIFDKKEVVLDKTIDSRAFFIVYSGLLIKSSIQENSILPWHISSDIIEIESYQDWWVCEKLFNRKKIIFRVIGNKSSGMGHIYRSLSLAHEITDHEILFICEPKDKIAVTKFAGYDYRLEVYDSSEIIEKIINLKPDLVINDILSTTDNDVHPLQENDIMVVNFEDLGDGAKSADLVINELYDEPLINGNNILWGSKYFFLREEFFNSKPNQFKNNVDSLLLSFGGTDQHGLARKIFKVIQPFCQKMNITVNIVAGYGSKNFDKLKEEVSFYKNVNLTKSTGVMSGIMEKSQIAIVSNGRTTYELAHLNIPAIVISQHQRESLHTFSSHSGGFISIGQYKAGESELKVIDALKSLVDNNEYRQSLFNELIKYDFNLNKSTVINSIYSLID